MNRPAEQSGFALIATMVAMGILLALVLPFLSAVMQEGAIAGAVVDAERTQQLASGQRELLLYRAGQLHPAQEYSLEGGTPDWDGRDEYPGLVPMPEVFDFYNKGLLNSAEIYDLQRRIHLPTASPLVLANLLGLATHLAEEVEPEGSELRVLDATNFPEENGSLLVNGERIDYQSREGNVFLGLRRRIEQRLPYDALVLDYRVVMAVTWQFAERFGGRRDRFQPYASVGELQRIGEVPGTPGRFTRAQMDVLEAHCRTAGMNDYAQRFGKEVRVVNALDNTGSPHPALRTTDALGLGGGTVVRIRSLKDPTKQEFNFVFHSESGAGGVGEYNLQSRWRLKLLFPLQQSFEAMETVVQAMLPTAVNINTADREVIRALLANLRYTRSRNRRHEEPPTTELYGMRLDPAQVDDIVQRILDERAGLTQDGPGNPFQSFEDFTKRIIFPLAEDDAASGSDARRFKSLLVLMLENLLSGRAKQADMGTMPISFNSSSLVEYRVASLQVLGSGRETARREMRGLASVMPGHGLDTLWFRQKDYTEVIRLNRRAPGYLSLPISVGTIDSRELASDPPSLAGAMLWAKLHPEAGLGTLRYPSHDKGSIRARSVVSVPQTHPRVRAAVRGREWGRESFVFSDNPEGWDTAKQGPFELRNSGPRSGGVQSRRSGRHELSFAYTAGNEGMPARFATRFWFRLNGLGDQSLFDFAADDADRNRINLRLEGDNLVLEMLDEAGIDPNPSEETSAPERSAGVIRIPIADFNLQPRIWYHATFAADGNRPDQLSLLIDGHNRGKPEFVTYLSAEIPVWKRPQTGSRRGEDKEEHLEIRVESTEGFPESGTLRIGRELFEYTSKDEGTFYCTYADSRGGRKARQAWVEFHERIEVDEAGRAVENPDQLTDLENIEVPGHPSGAAVYLYGYAAPIYRNQPINTGRTSLRESMGAFSVARCYVQNPERILLQGSQQTFSPGEGILDTNNGDLMLADPLPDEEKNVGKDPEPASEQITAGFPSSGGYALLIQRTISHQAAVVGGQLPPQPVTTGGIELIQYSARNGNKLTGVTRAATITGADKLLGNRANAPASTFVTRWAPNLVSRGGNANAKPVPLGTLYNYMLWIVPISLPVADRSVLYDPADNDYRFEWAQIYPGKGSEENTEWVRYNFITQDGHLTHLRWGYFRRLERNLTGSNGQVGSRLANGGGGELANSEAAWEFQAAPDDGLTRVGYTDRIEKDWPCVYWARTAYPFRGDSWTGTSSHAHGGNSVVLPCHRLELDWGRMGAFNARTGRNDRVAFVGGTKASGDSRPPMEWHSINWVRQRQSADNIRVEQAPDSTEPQRWGLYPFQLIGLKAPVQEIFVGPENRDDLRDTRRTDRVVKFPSGELPAAYVESAQVGGVSKQTNDYRAMRGDVDEIDVLGRGVPTLMLEEPLDEAGTQIKVRKHRRWFSWGTITTAADLTQAWPAEGGLMMIDQEIIAYRSRADGSFEVATEGRGLLGTEPKAHNDAAPVQFLPHIPAAILSGQVGASDHQIQVQALGSLPRYGGTLRLGNELVHYLWTVQDTGLEMPQWFDPEQDDPPGVGLFRGRFGTQAQSWPSGAVVVEYPVRYWDRYHERSNDPALHYFQVTRRETPVYFTNISWRTENPDPMALELVAVANIDEAGSFADDPTQVPGMYTFDKGTVDDQPQVLGRQGSLFEMRIATKYKPGAFDPVEFRANGYKRALEIKDMVLQYQGQTRILKEQTTQR